MRIIAELVTPILNPNIPFNANLIRVMHDELDVMERAFNRTTRTWTSDSKPEWIKEVGVEGLGSALVGTIFTRDFPFIWVEAGTPRGRVAFSRDYQPKTRAGVIGSRSGRGKVLARGSRAPITKGVGARNFRYLIAERREPQVVKNMIGAIDRGVKKFFVGTKVKRVII